MDQTRLTEAYRCLDLPPGAPPLQVERTYRRKRALYAEESLATYALFDAEGRRLYLARLEEAYRQICGDVVSPRPAAPNELPADDERPASADLSPGGYLRRRREERGMSLREVADITKIGTRRLLQMEEEHFHLLPAPVYLRGFLIAYARALGLADAGGIVARYLERCQAEADET